MKKNSSPVYLGILAVLCVIFAWGAVKYIHSKYPEAVTDIPTPPPPREPQEKISTPSSSPTTAEPAAPKTLLLPVPFTMQAPTANWSDPLYGEGCEEASALMAHEYFAGNRENTLDSQYALEEIKRLTDWELKTLGYNLDINTEETVKLLKEVYGLQAKIVTDFSEQSLKQELAQNRLILLPANGKLLGNPNFRSPGPPYHMLVVKGYNSGGFVTNDPGTRKGMNYPYTYQTLYKANGDFDHSTHEVNLDKKMVIVVWDA